MAICPTWARLAAFKTEHGVCRRVAQKLADPKLGTWVSMQRAVRSRVTRTTIRAGRAAKLAALGLQWVVPKRKR